MDNTWWQFARDNSLNPAARRVILNFKVSQCRRDCTNQDCWGYHSLHEKRRRPLNLSTGALLYQDEMCSNGRECPFYESCSFAHTVFEMNYHPYRYKTRVCPGACNLELLCAFSHYPSDLRSHIMQRAHGISQSSSGCEWSESDKLFFIVCWVSLVDSNSLDLEKAQSLHNTLVRLVPPGTLFRDGGGSELARILQSRATSQSQLSTANSTIDQ